MTENKTMVSIGFDNNGLPQASIEATGEPYKNVVEDAKKIIEYLTDFTMVGKEVEYMDDDEEDDDDYDE